MGKYTAKEETVTKTATVSNSQYIKQFASNFLTTISGKNSWGTNQAIAQFVAMLPDTSKHTRLVRAISKQFAGKVNVQTSWSKNQIELMFISSVANAALMLLDSQ